jgi:P-type E1-E2 ATPase
MKETTIIIPNYKTLNLTHIVLDYNGTLAKDGVLKDEVKTLLPELVKSYRVHVITADTFGSVHAQVKDFDVVVKVLESDNHTVEKAEYVQSLVAKTCAAVGNGNNDALMLKTAELGVALLGDEGCSTQTMMQSDLVCKTIQDALELFINTNRLVATLRK